MKRAITATASGRYIATDVLVTSRSSLAALAQALPDAYQPMGARGRPMARVLVLNGTSRGSVEGDVRRLVKRIKALRGASRHCWQAASRRIIDIGIEAGAAMPAFESVQLSTETLEALTVLGVQIKVTVYPPGAYDS